VREQLRSLSEEDYWVYGVTAGDFPHAISLVREMIAARDEQWQRHEAQVRAENPYDAEDILDDPAFYRYTNNQFLWAFSIWRLQGLLEAVICYQLLDPKQGAKLFGLRAKLDAAREAGAELTEEEYDELILWGNLRNAISHAPPEIFRPAPIREQDAVEYHDFVVSLYERWTGKEVIRGGA